MDALKSKGQMYDQIDLGGIPRSGFDLSYSFMGTGRLGRLIPIRCMETMPGDRWKGSTAINVNFRPLAVPMMSNMYMRTETFKIPYRLLWDDWDEFWTGGKELDLSSAPILPMASFSDLFKSFSIRVGGSSIVQREDLLLKIPVTPIYLRAYSTRESTGSGPTLRTYPMDSAFATSFGIKLSDLRSWIQTWREGIIGFGNGYDMLDLFEQPLSVLDSMEAWLKTKDYKWNKNPYFDSFAPIAGKTGFVISTTNTAGELATDLNCPAVIPVFGFKEPADGGNGYFNYDPSTWTNSTLVDLYKDGYITNIMHNFGGTDGAELSEFSVEYCDFLQYWYDFICDWFGKGSNLDFLGAPKILLRDVFAGALYTLGERMSMDGFDIQSDFLSAVFAEDYISSRTFSVMPLRALYMVWYYFYRDKLLEVDAMEPQHGDVYFGSQGSRTGSYLEMVNIVVPRFRCWSKDTFTTALTNTGTGSMVVPVKEDIITMKRTLQVFNENYHNGKDFPLDGESAKLQGMDIFDYELSDGKVIKLPTRYLLNGNSPTASGAGVEQDNTLSSGFSLDMLTRAQRMQKWLQKALIYGNLVEDALWTHFRVRSSDARLRIPEMLASDSRLVQLNTITNNTTTAESVAGDKSATAYGYTDGSAINTFCEEHGLIITLFTVMPQATYGYGWNRLYSRSDIFDFPFPEFAQLGMDAVYMHELVGGVLDLPESTLSNPKPVSVSPDAVFGYQGRYYDWKCKQDEIHGDLLDVMDMYTFARKFSPYGDKTPALNYAFVHCHPRTDMFVLDSNDDSVMHFDVLHRQAVEHALPVPSMSV